jgi:hypothetical protein
MDSTLDLENWCRSGALPDADTFFKTFVDQNGRFTQSEGEAWDFKKEWPFSYSNEYFHGICRLACAFSNSYGGLMIFGVDDKDRTGGHNKVRVNVDKFLASFQNLTGYKLKISTHSYSHDEFGSVDVLLICARENDSPPLRFVKPANPYPQNTIWIRSGHEVVIAGPEHFPQLFCRVSPTDSPPERDGWMPPRSATIKKFVGRVEVLDQLFHWYLTSDEPRQFIHGKGGSGKTTIAHEFSRLIKDFGANILVNKRYYIDSVIFLSAKEKKLSTLNQSTQVNEEPDFTDEKSLLTKILYFGGWIGNLADLENMSVIDLKKEFRDYMAITCVLIVIDDIDTLTTKGIDPGSDFLYRVICENQSKSRVLYTLRNAPSQSLDNSIEVPGLTGIEYDSFVDECVKQFRVIEPSKDFRDSRLPRLSECRPLVIESIIALVRTSGSYEQAERLFLQNVGDDVRQYVFMREWDALSGDTLPRLVLSALSELKTASTFVDLQTVLQVEESRLNDAIGKVREMFLQIDITGKDTLFSLGSLTRQFVNSQKSTLKDYSLVLQRVNAFRKGVRITRPEVISIGHKIDQLMPPRLAEHTEEKMKEALRIVSNKSLSLSITEDPVFKSILGYVLVHQNPQKLVEARDAFKYATDMRYEPSFPKMRSWFEAEKRSGSHDGWCQFIADFIINGKSYSEFEKIGMHSRKANSIYARAVDRLYTEPTDAKKDFLDALLIHLKVFKLNSLNDNKFRNNSEAYANQSARYLFQLSSSESVGGVFDSLRDVASTKDVYLDPIRHSLLDQINHLPRTNLNNATVNILKNKIRGIANLLGVDEQWLNKIDRDELRAAIVEYEALLKSIGK